MGRLSKRNKNPINKKGWKFQDDYTGAAEYSHNAERDEDGWITVKGKADKPDPKRKGYPSVKEELPPWTRPITDNPTASTTLDEDTDY